MNALRPIFIIGIGRSGSTIFFDILSRHPDLVWLSSRICNRYPDRPEFNRALMSCINIPYIGEIVRRYFEPGECYKYWDTLYRGFGSSYRDLEGHDITECARERILTSFSEMVKKPNVRLVIKITGWNRMRFLKEIFPEALFIHVERDPRAVINSFLDVYFWPGWKGPGNLLREGLTVEEKDELVRFNSSFVALAGIKLLELKKAYVDAKNEIQSKQLFEVTYESLCSDPVSVYKEACRFCDLNWSKQFVKEVKSSRLKNTNYKWQEDLSKSQQEVAQYYYEKLSKI